MTESTRVRSISILDRKCPNLSERLALLAEFGDLPALTYLNLSLADGGGSYGGGELYPINDIRYPPEGLLFSRMPSIQRVQELSFTAPMLKDERFANLRSVKVHQIDTEMVTALNSLSSLIRLQFTDEPFGRNDPADTLSHVQLRKIDVKPFYYYGISLVRAVSRIGDSLVSLSATANIYGIETLLIDLSRFRVLREVSLNIYRTPDQSTALQNRMNVNIDPIFLQLLRLQFRTYHHSDDYGADEDEITTTLKSQVQIYESTFLTLSHVVPFADTVELGGHFMTKPGLQYVCGLKQLRSLRFTPDTPEVNTHYLNVDRLPEHLLRAICLPFVVPTDFLDKISHHSLDNLIISNDSFDSALYIRPRVNLNDFQAIFRYEVPSRQLRSLGVLKIRIYRPLILDLDAFSGLRSISFEAWWRQVSWASDFLEEILLRPNTLPSLEHIGIEGTFMEWDILILMLERRNFVAQAGTSRIETLHFDAHLPYRLLHPLTLLLGGRFAERPSLKEFSIEAIGNRIWDPKISGCYSCVSMFRTCDLAPTAYKHRHQSWNYKGEDSRFGWSYSLPSERVVPDPPLSTHLMEWVREKRKRRLNYVEMSRKAGPEVDRIGRCDSWIIGGQTIGGYSLDGAHFGEETLSGD